MAEIFLTSRILAGICVHLAGGEADDQDTAAGAVERSEMSNTRPADRIVDDIDTAAAGPPP